MDQNFQHIHLEIKLQTEQVDRRAFVCKAVDDHCGALAIAIVEFNPQIAN